MNKKLEIIKGSENYCATIVTIKDLFPVEGADRIVRTVIFGNNVIVSKDTKLNEKFIYFVSGTRVNEEFCKYNNLLTDAELNKDKKAGFVSHKQFRIKAIKLKGIISDGILLPLESLASFTDISSLQEGDTFTTINDFKLCEKYFVPSRNANPNGKAPKQPKKVSRLIENLFSFHNDTENLRRNIQKIIPSDIIGIHYKKHGTSAVYSNIPVLRKLTWYENILKKLGVSIKDTTYDVIYSSRKVIKNDDLNKVETGFYSEDIWGIVKNEIADKIPKNWTLYGEIIGYLPSGGFIQGGYDYGCKIGEHKFYVYKISVVNPDRKVIYLTDKQIEEFCEKNGLLYEDTFIYYGVAKDLFSYASINNVYQLITWREYFLSKLEELYNEKDCYMCVNKVPEEGIILRVENLESYEAYKLKSKRFLLHESEEQEKEITNVEDEN